VKRIAFLSLTLCLVTLLALQCGTIAAVRALRKDESALAISCGGPVTRVSGLDIPLPYAVARYRYGVNDRFGLYAGSHLLLLALGEIGLEGGFSYQLLNQQRWIPALSLSGGLSAMVKPGSDERLFPELALAASYLAADRFLTYFGVQSMYQFRSPVIVWAPLLGEEVKLGRRVALALEAKWYAPTEITKPRVVDYRLPIAGHGALGFVLGVNYLFGGRHE
jgi:hypothetical protein